LVRVAKGEHPKSIQGGTGKQKEKEIDGRTAEKNLETRPGAKKGPGGSLNDPEKQMATEEIERDKERGWPHLTGEGTRKWNSHSVQVGLDWG